MPEATAAGGPRSFGQAGQRRAIENALDTGLRASTPELYRRKCSAVFEYFHESYLVEHPLGLQYRGFATARRRTDSLFWLNAARKERLYNANRPSWAMAA
jgi:hypothetical protein